MTERNEITPDEMDDVVGGKQTRQAGDIEGTVEGKKARLVRDGKTTIRRHADPK